MIPGLHSVLLLLPGWVGFSLLRLVLPPGLLWRGDSGFSFPEASTSLSVCLPILDSSRPPSVIPEHGGSRLY